MNTLISTKLVESEDSKTIYQFLNESLRNQKRISIGTDLKQEYREAKAELKVKHPFYKFHMKQSNKQDLKTILTNPLTEEEKDKLSNLKEDIYKILDARPQFS